MKQLTTFAFLCLLGIGCKQEEKKVIYGQNPTGGNTGNTRTDTSSVQFPDTFKILSFTNAGMVYVLVNGSTIQKAEGLFSNFEFENHSRLIFSGEEIKIVAKIYDDFTCEIFYGGKMYRGIFQKYNEPPVPINSVGESMYKLEFLIDWQQK